MIPGLLGPTMGAAAATTAAPSSATASLSAQSTRLTDAGGGGSPASDLDLALEALGKGLLSLGAGMQERRISRQQIAGALPVSAGSPAPSQIASPGLLGLQQLFAGASRGNAVPFPQVGF